MHRVNVNKLPNYVFFETIVKCVTKRRNFSVSSVVLRNNESEDDKTGPSGVVPRNARVVICGGGTMGASVAYYMGKYGWGSDTVLIEQNKIGGGTTWHASGLVGVFKPSLSQVRLTKCSIELYKELEAKGIYTGWKQCGSLNVARTHDRMISFKRMKAQSVSWNIECEILTPEQCFEKCGLLNVDDLQGGIWIPGDGVADPYQTCLSLVDEAKKQG